MRQTIKDIEVNVAYRWFLGLDMKDSVPHFPTFGKNYSTGNPFVPIRRYAFLLPTDICSTFMKTPPTNCIYNSASTHNVYRYCCLFKVLETIVSAECYPHSEALSST